MVASVLAKELIDKRMTLVTEARALDKKAKAEKRDLTAEERSRWDTIMADEAKIKGDIDKAEAEAREDEKRSKWLGDSETDLESTNRDDRPERTLKRSGNSETRDDLDDGGEGPQPRVLESRSDPFDFHRRLYRSMRYEPIRHGRFHPGRTKRDYHDGYMAVMKTYLGLAPEERERRALSAGSFTEGGATYMSEQFHNELIKFVDNETFARRICRTIPLRGADSAIIPSYDTDPDDADWTSELLTGSADASMAFGGRKLTPHPIAKRLLISNTLIERSAMNMVAFAQERLGYKFGVTQEKAFMTGTGSNQALGVFTAHAQGISTGRDMSTGNTTTAMTPNGLKAAVYALKAPHRRSASWVFHRDGVLQIAQFTDGEGRYMWQPSISLGEPDQLLGRPMFDSEYAPNTFTTGLYVGILGNFAHFWFVEALSYRIQKLSELYAATNQVGLIARAEIDGAPVLEEAFVRVKLA